MPFVWRMPNLLPVMLPWLVVLALLALPSNRSLRAWWIWAPLGVVALIGAVLQPPITMTNNEGFYYCVQAACSAAFGLAAAWLLGAALARRGRVLAIALMALVFAVVSLLAFVLGPAGEQLSDISRWEPAVLLYLVLFWIVGGLAFAGALNLTGWRCRRRFSRRPVTLWLLLWLWAMWLVAGGVLGALETLTSGGGFEWMGVLVASFVLALVSFAVALPYAILSFANSFYRERLRHLLRLPAEAPVTPVPEAPPVLEQAVQQ